MKKIITKATTCLPILMLLFTSSINSQSLTEENIRSQMIKDWERAKAYTVDYLNTMPADKYSFKAVDSLRSFAQQMLHLAAGNCFLMLNATDQKTPSWFGSDIEHSATAQNKDSVMYYIISSYDYCMSAIRNTYISKWGEKKKMFNTFEETRFALINKTFEHQSHHRGQTTIYIRLQNIRPPQERLFQVN